MAEPGGTRDAGHVSGFKPWCYVNDLRLSASDRLEPPGLDDSTRRHAVRNSEVSRPESLDRFAWRFRPRIFDAPEAAGLPVTAAGRYLQPEQITSLLRQIEQLPAEAASRDVARPWRSEPA